MKNTLLAIIFILLPPTITYYLISKNCNLPQEEQVTVVTEQPTFEGAKDSISKEDCKRIMEFLADDKLEGRMSGKKGNRITAKYIKKKFESFGLTTVHQKFPVRQLNDGPHNEKGDAFSYNIIGTRNGETEKTIVIGGHFDHIGWGPSMSRDNIVGVHNGADDNASGTTAVIELAEAFSKSPTLKHKLVFICFSGEELGLIGSQYYVGHTTEKIDYMINLDMVGRLRNNSLQAIGANNELQKLLDKLDNDYTLKVQNAAYNEGSDHAPFAYKQIPIVFLTTGLHQEYHTVSDDANLINYDGLEEITKFVFDLVIQLDN